VNTGDDLLVAQDFSEGEHVALIARDDTADAELGDGERALVRAVPGANRV